MTYTQNISLDVSAVTIYQYTITAKQYDNISRTVVATITENGQQIKPDTGCTVQFRALKPDGKCVVNPATLNSDGTVTVELTEQALACAGNVYADIVFLKDDEVLSTVSFMINVSPAAFNGDEAASSNEFLIFQEAIERAEAAADRAEKDADELESVIADAQKQLDEIVDAAAEAVKNAETELSNIVADAQKQLDEIVDAAAEAVKNAETALAEAESAIKTANDAAEKANASAETALESAESADDAAEKANAAAETANATVAEVKDDVEKFLDDAGNTVDELVNDTNQKVDEAIAKTDEAVENAGVATDKANEAAAKANEAAENLNELAYLKTVTLNSGEWYETVDGMGRNCWAYDISMSRIQSPAAWSVMVGLPMASYFAAAVCRMYPTVTISEGMFTVYAKNEPEYDFDIECTFFNQKTSEDEENQVYIQETKIDKSEWMQDGDVFKCVIKGGVEISNSASWSVMVAVQIASYNTAQNCGVYATAQLQKGDDGEAEITMWAENQPEDDIDVECTIFSSTFIS